MAARGGGTRPLHPAWGQVRAVLWVVFILVGLGLPYFYRFLKLNSILRCILLHGFVKHLKTWSFKMLPCSVGAL